MYDWSESRLPAEHWVRMDRAIYDEGSEDGVMTVQTSHLLTDGIGSSAPSDPMAPAAFHYTLEIPGEPVAPMPAPAERDEE